MSKDFIKSSAARHLPPALITAAWIVALGIPSLMLHTSQVQAARRAAETEVLTEVANAINSPCSSRGEVMALLAKRQGELSDTRYVRVCNRLGIPMDWNTIFKRIAKSGKAEQVKAAQIIAEECDMGAGITLKTERMTLALKMIKVVPTENTVPIAVPMRRSVD